LPIRSASKRYASIYSLLALLATFAVTPSFAQARDIRLDIKPRICTLSTKDEYCSTPVRASWQASQPESLCLVIAGRTDIKECWEQHSRGTYSVELIFAEDLLVELRDPSLQNVLATKTLQVIREALEFRRKRRQPWSIIY
jgi:hypothetical protein